jgi:hemerythrin-like domain-containing protein
MEATEILKSEHRVIEGVLRALSEAADRVEGEKAIRPSFFLDAADFIKDFADGCHHRKEEGVLFKAMASAGVPVQNGPIGVMLAEHEQGRAFTRAMRQAAEQLQAGDLSTNPQLIRAARGYVDLLQHHIAKEDQILFPMADRAIPLDQHEQVLRDFERVEHTEIGEGVHEKYSALAQALQDELAST